MIPNLICSIRNSCISICQTTDSICITRGFKTTELLQLQTSTRETTGNEGEDDVQITAMKI